MSPELHAPVRPLPPKPSRYGPDPSMIRIRAADLKNMVSIGVRELFSGFPEAVYPSEKGISTVREATEEALSKVDMSMIKPGDSVNILGSHHGFTILGGEPYAEMLKATRDFIVEETGAEDIRLRAGVGLRFRESDEYIERFHLDEYFDGKAIGVAPIDEGIAIETEIGTLYGLKKCYDAKWIVHAHNSDVREIHFHRHVDRAVKPFGMSYARIETRSTYHHNLGPRGANFAARAIFNSQFIQKKWTFATFLRPTPAGIIGVDADNDLFRLDRRIAIDNFRYYGKILTLLGKIRECIAVLDFQAPIPYVFSAGMIFANFSASSVDIFDLDNPLPGYTWYTESFYGRDEKPIIPEVAPINPAIKALIINYAWGGYPSVFWAKKIPTIVVGEWQADVFRKDPQNVEFMKHALIAEDLESAIEMAMRITGTDKILAFDGAPGAINLSKSLALDLINMAPDVDREVEGTLLPKWCKQRGISFATNEILAAK
ncbi:MAG: hypothetical protein QHH00_07625 [Methanomassiliicoccales archaeon]|nr:hypothetical protein [Methanomassiliicoccales archaeon]